MRKFTALDHLTATAQAVKAYTSQLVAELAQAAARDIAAVRSIADDAKTAASSAQTTANNAKTAADSAKAAAVTMKGATASAAGTAGLAPTPEAGAQGKYLRGDGTWQTPPDTNTTYTAASAAPKAAGTAAVGTSEKYAREDHVHPAQTSVSGNAGTATKLVAAHKIGNASFDGAADVTLAQIGAAARPVKGSFTIPVSGWGTDSTTGYTKYYDVAVSGVTANDRADVIIAAGSVNAAAACGLCPVSETMAGKVRIRATKVPSAAISAEYWIEKE